MVVVLGGGQHAAVVADALASARRWVTGYYDDRPSLDNALSATYQGTLTDYIDGLGLEPYILGIGDNATRATVVARLAARRDAPQEADVTAQPPATPPGFTPPDTPTLYAADEPHPLLSRDGAYVYRTHDAAPAVIHPTATVAATATIGAGSYVGPHAVIERGVTIGRHCIVNAGALITHDCVVEDYCHIAPGVTLCGGVQVDAGVLVGANATVLPQRHLGAWSVIGAGSTVLTHVYPNLTVKGVVNRDAVQPPVAWLPRKHADVAVLGQRLVTHLTASQSRNHFSNGGPAVHALGERLTTLLQVDPATHFVLPVCNGTAALHALAAALSLHAGRPLRFATQAFTFPASVQGCLAGALIVDTTPEGGPDVATLTPEQLHAIDGLVITNCFGCVTPLAYYEEWARQHGKYLLLDNAATATSHYHGRNTVTYGTGSIISLHHTKPLGFGEGGAIIVQQEYADALRRVINFGYDVPKGDMVWHALGSNYKMSDVAAAGLLSYLTDYEVHAARMRELWAAVERCWPASMRAALFPTAGECSWYSCLPVLLPRTVTLERVYAVGRRHRVDLRKYYKPLAPLPGALTLWARIVCFPFHYDIDEGVLARYVAIWQELVAGQGDEMEW